MITYRAPIVPKRDIALAPLKPGMQLRARGDHLVQEGDDCIRLGLGDADNLGDETGVKEEAFPASDGVGAHEGVRGGDGSAAHGALQFAGSLGLEVGGVKCGERGEVVLHGRGEHVVGCVL